MSDEVETIRAAYEATLAAGPARFTYGIESHWQLPPMPEQPQRNAAQRVALGIGKTAAKTVGKGFLRLLSRKSSPWNRDAEGIIDLAGRRMMLDYGHFAELQIDAEGWSGRSGRRLSTLPSQPTRASSPLWIVELLAGANHATSAEPDPSEVSEDSENVGQRFSATASLPAAIAAHGRPMSSPAKDSYDDLLAIPVDVWVKDGLLRKVRLSTKTTMNTDRRMLTLVEFGIDIEDLDWTRLPTFRSPEEAWDASERGRRHTS